MHKGVRGGRQTEGQRQKGIKTCRQIDRQTNDYIGKDGFREIVSEVGEGMRGRERKTQSLVVKETYVLSCIT